MWVVYAVACGNGIGVATSFLLPWAMLPDTIDDSELRSVRTKQTLWRTETDAAHNHTHSSAPFARALAFLPTVAALVRTVVVNL